ncbi:DUF1801 domain-containing protein [Lutimaribacter marinistellae]|uniref:DUF1801 domain-containing protein n=1 Tax=Lutimaribacter marinistellae TaxID=1820329 RepID=A0ABV7TBF8_9RHOB
MAIEVLSGHVQSDGVAAAFASIPEESRAGLLKLRALILDTAQRLEQPVEETLRWGQPSYIAPKGSALRIWTHKAARFALFVHCQTRLMEEHRTAFPGMDRIDGNRAILFDTTDEIDPDRHGMLIARALTYKQTR